MTRIPQRPSSAREQRVGRKRSQSDPWMDPQYDPRSSPATRHSRRGRPSPHEGPGLRRLGLATATAMVVGEVIGVGIFLTPAGMAKSLGSPSWLIAVWLTMGASAIGGALCFGGLAARYPEAGGLYVYLREAFGPRTAFLFGWLSMLVTDPGLTAMLAVGLADYVAHLVPLSGWGLKGVAVAAIVVLAGVNMVGNAIGSGVLRALAGLKLGLLAFLVAWGFGFGRGDWSNLTPFWSQRPGSEPLAGGPGRGPDRGPSSRSRAGGTPARSRARSATPSAPCRARWCWACRSSRSCTSPSAWYSSTWSRRTRSRPIRTRRHSRPWPAGALFGRTGEVVFSAIVVASVAGSLAAVLMASPRVYYAMARDGLFFPGFAAVDPRRGTPARAVAIQATLASLLALTGSFDQILGLLHGPDPGLPGVDTRRGLRPPPPLALDVAGRARPDRARLPGHRPAGPRPDPDRDRPADPARSPSASRSGWPSSCWGCPSPCWCWRGDGRPARISLTDDRSGIPIDRIASAETLNSEMRSSRWPGFERRPSKGEDEAVHKAMADQRPLVSPGICAAGAGARPGRAGDRRLAYPDPAGALPCVRHLRRPDVARPAARSAGSTR